MANDMSWFFAQDAPPRKKSDLYTAASRCDVELLKEAVLRKDEDVIINGWSAVHVAAAKGHLDALIVLHQGLYPVNDLLLGLTTSFPKSNCLHLAAAKGQVPVCSYLISNFRHAVDSTDEDGHSALHIAAFRGNTDICKLLVEEGANPSMVNSEDMTPALLATASGNLETFRLFAAIEDGALLTSVSSGGQNALMKAAQCGHVDILNEIIHVHRHLFDVNMASLNGGSSALHLASGGGNSSIVKTLIKAGADVNLLTEAGQSSLHKACFQSQGDVVEILLEHGADPNQGDVKGYTPLMAAASGGSHHIVEKLCSNPALNVSIAATLDNGEDAAILAGKNGFKDLASKITRRVYVEARVRALLDNPA